MDEPRLLPTYPGEVYPDRWYCFHCPQHRDDAYTLHVHLGAQHDITDPRKGDDYGDGEQVALIQLQREFFLVDAPAHFARQLDSLRGGDDFVFEAGGEVTDA